MPIKKNIVRRNVRFKDTYVERGAGGLLGSPVTLVRCCTVEVFPVPVSPTSSTGSPLATHTANCSSSTAEGRVAANVWLSLFMEVK